MKIHIYSKYKDGKFGNYSYEEERPLKIGEYSSLTKLVDPDLSDDVLIEKASQQKIDAIAESKIKEDKINAYAEAKNTFGIAETSDGAICALVLGDDKKLKVVEII